MSDIKIFANAANVASTNAATDSTAGGTKLSIPIYDSAKGIVINDDSADNRDEFDTGFIAKTPSSSVTLNTILRQCSTMAKILADVCEQTTGVTTAPASAPNNNANKVAGKLTELLNKINGLITGTSIAAKATEASNYIEGGTIQQKAKEHFDEIQKILSGATVVKAAMYAEGDTSSTINSRINNLSVRINSLIKSNPVEVTSFFGTVGSSSVIKSGNLVLIRNLVINKGSAITGSSSYQTIAKLKNITISNVDNVMICQSTGVGIFGSSGGGTFSFDTMLSSDGSDVIVSCKFPKSGTLTSVTLQHIGFEIKNIVE